MNLDFFVETPTVLAIGIQLDEHLEKENESAISELVEAGWSSQGFAFDEQNLLRVTNFDAQILGQELRKSYNITQCIRDNIQNKTICKEYPLVSPKPIEMILLFKQVLKDERVKIDFSKKLLLSTMFAKEIKCESFISNCVEGDDVPQEVDTLLEKSPLDSEEFSVIPGDITPDLHALEILETLKVPEANFRNEEQSFLGQSIRVFVDIEVNQNDCVWAIDRERNVYYRKNIREELLEGR
jgi:hypothetical protein